MPNKFVAFYAKEGHKCHAKYLELKPESDAFYVPAAGEIGHKNHIGHTFVTLKMIYGVNRLSYKARHYLYHEKFKTDILTNSHICEGKRVTYECTEAYKSTFAAVRALYLNGLRRYAIEYHPKWLNNEEPNDDDYYFAYMLDCWAHNCIAEMRYNMASGAADLYTDAPVHSKETSGNKVAKEEKTPKSSARDASRGPVVLRTGSDGAGPRPTGAAAKFAAFCSEYGIKNTSTAGSSPCGRIHATDSSGRRPTNSGDEQEIGSTGTSSSTEEEKIG